MLDEELLTNEEQRFANSDLGQILKYGPDFRKGTY